MYIRIYVKSNIFMPNREEFPTTYHPIRVLFLCTGNSARSQMAEALLRTCGGTDFEAASAGTDPKGLKPLTIEVMAEAGIDVSTQQSKSLDRFLDQSFDYVITVGDRARDNCPTFPGDNERNNWSVADGTEARAARQGRRGCGFDDPAAARSSSTYSAGCATKSASACGCGWRCSASSSARRSRAADRCVLRGAGGLGPDLR